MGKKSNRGWSSTPIRQLIENRHFGVDSTDGKNQLELMVRGLTKKDQEKIVSAALSKFVDAEELKPYQAELIRLQNHLDKTGRKVIILFDGRDASGKGGTIRRVTRYMNEKHYRVIALGKPTKNQLTELHMKRYIEHFPHAGQIVLFDRSWYNRAMVEPIMGFCTRKQYRDFIDKVSGYEESFVADGQTTLIKLYFSVSKKEQERRFSRRRDDPLRHWKLSEVDLQAQELWDEFSEAKYRLLKRTHTASNPWWVIRSDNKQRARLETMKLILSLVKYRGRRRNLDFVPDPKIVIPGDVECKRMERSKRKHGVYVR
jgi:polyphosphate kinase 2